MVLLNVTTTERTNALTGLLNSNTQGLAAIRTEIGSHTSTSFSKLIFTYRAFLTYSRVALWIIPIG